MLRELRVNLILFAQSFANRIDGGVRWKAEIFSIFPSFACARTLENSG